MPREIRQIFFDQDETIVAVSAFRRTHPDFLPQGEIKKVQLCEAGLTATIEMKYGETVHMLDFKVDSAHLTEVLVKFCGENNIAIPKAGRPRPVIAGNAVMLEIALQP